MYGGDEVSAIVLDLGSHSVKAGYAGHDTPQCVFSSSVGTTATLSDDDDDACATAPRAVRPCDASFALDARESCAT